MPGSHPLNLDYREVGTNFLNRRKAGFGTLDAWICTECGFTELWASDLDKFVHAPERGVQLIEG
jgi:hypothetical protein